MPVRTSRLRVESSAVEARWTLQWRLASGSPRQLVERGARTALWHAAALGVMDHLETYFAGAAPCAPQEVTDAFWCACHGGQRAAEYVVERGADLFGSAMTSLTPADAAERSNAIELVGWLRAQGARSACELD
jgi:uncharacterized protein